MNTTTHRTATTLAAATAVAGALTIMSAVAPTAASARRVDPVADPAARCAVSTGDASSTAPMDIAEIVTMLKVRRAKYLFDHPYLLR
ncbi:hypothetical protein ACFU7D_03995 [Nocardioides sp. NPDC057577]|uniref:hypothetical protein n=1 Tax=Nocardioides sp. NPDC057577 TaxID=3346171 RepID=UPI00366D46F9